MATTAIMVVMKTLFMVESITPKPQTNSTLTFQDMAQRNIAASILLPDMDPAHVALTIQLPLPTVRVLAELAVTVILLRLDMAQATPVSTGPAAVPLAQAVIRLLGMAPELARTGCLVQLAQAVIRILGMALELAHTGSLVQLVQVVILPLATGRALTLVTCQAQAVTRLQQARISRAY